jgi:tRNA A-37 threonylcarbamoyl transferase component Bud32
MEHAATERRLGRYRLTARIGRGGMAEVWAAELVAAGGFRKPLVLKRVRPEHAGDWDLLRRFLGEARLAARLAHPNLVTVYELGDADGEYFLAMEYLRGATVAELRDRGPLPPAEVIAIVTAAAAGLAHLHDLRDERGAPAGFIHRDLSATNLMVTSAGAVKILDFGIAKPEHAEVSSAGAARGTLGYMAPEQLAGARLDRRADLWALGVLGWELCTGARLFAGPPAAAIDAIRAGAVPALVERGVPPAVAAALHACLAVDPAARPASADQLRQQLTAALAPATVDALAARVEERAGAAMAERDRGFARDDEPTAALAPAPAPTARAAQVAVRATPTRAAGRRRWAVGLAAAAIAGLAAVALAGLAAVGDRGDRRHAGPDASAPPDPPAPTAPSTAAVARLAITASEPAVIRVLGPGGDLTLGRTPLDDVPIVPGLYILFATADDERSCVKSIIVDAGGVNREAVRLPATLADSPGDC